MSGTPEIFKDGFGPRWRVVEAFDLRTGAKLFSMPNTVYQGHLIAAEMPPSGPEMKLHGLTAVGSSPPLVEQNPPKRIKDPACEAFWEVIDIARRRFKISLEEF